MKYMPFTFFITLLICSGCQKTPCFSIKPAPVTTVFGPDSGVVNSDINFSLTYICSNGCGEFHTVKEKKNDHTRIIKVKAKYAGCTCTMAIDTQTTHYFFRTDKPGTYFLRFLQENDSFLEDTLVVK